MKKPQEEKMPEIDESLLTPEQKEELSRKKRVWPWLLFFFIIFALMAGCMIVIFSLR